MANENYIVDVNAELSINGEAGADYAWSVEGIGNQAGRVSAQIDLGADPRPYWYAWHAECQFQATPTQYKGLDLHYGVAPESDSTMIDGDVGATDAALADADMRKNLKWFGSLISENAAASEVCKSSGRLYIEDRYLTLVAFNDSGATTNATDSNFVFKLRPMANQGQ